MLDHIPKELIEQPASLMLCGTFVVFFYFSSFWDASLIGGGGGFLCTSRCLGEHEILVVWSRFCFWGSRTQKTSYSLSIMSPFLIGAFGSRSLLLPEDTSNSCLL